MHYTPQLWYILCHVHSISSIGGKKHLCYVVKKKAFMLYILSLYILENQYVLRVYILQK